MVASKICLSRPINYEEVEEIITSMSEIDDRFGKIRSQTLNISTVELISI